MAKRIDLPDNNLIDEEIHLLAECLEEKSEEYRDSLDEETAEVVETMSFAMLALIAYNIYATRSK